MRNAEHTLALVKSFPDSKLNKFSQEEWDTQFHESNVIIHCLGENIYYPVHWGPLSIKCAFGGKEYYQKGRCKYGVSDESLRLRASFLE